jgi:hypothetical protein
MNDYEQEILGIFDTVFENADQEVRDKAYDIYCEQVCSEDEQEEGEFEDYFMSLKSFIYKLYYDQLITQGVKPRDIPLKYMTSANTGMSVPFGKG